MDATRSEGTAADQDAVADGLFDVLYSELHRLARRELRRNAPFAALGVTTLLHEAYLKISASEGAVFVERGRFMAYAARVMRGLIIDDIRRQRAQKRGGLFRITSLGTDHADGVADPAALLKIGDVLDELARVEPDLAAIIELKFFCGFSFVEIAAMRGVSERTVQRNWEKGRLYLHHAITNERPIAKKRHAAAQR